MPDTNRPLTPADAAGEQPANLWHQIALLWTPKGILRTGLVLGIAYLLTMVLLGIIFQVILFALTLLFGRLIFIWTPAYHLAGRVAGAKGLPARLAKPPTWFLIYSVVWVLFWLVVAGVFTRLLFFAGFCQQNFLCMFARVFLK